MEDQTLDRGTIALRDGTTLAYRPIRASDREALQRFHRRHSEEAIYLRFFFMQRTLGDDQARHFTELDGVNRFALVALEPTAPEEIIGVARFDREPGTDRAEYAAIVATAWQERGLDLHLTQRLIEAAKRRGVAVLFTFILPQDLRMLSLLHELGLPTTMHMDEGVERIDIALGGGERPATTAVDPSPI